MAKEVETSPPPSVDLEYHLGLSDHPGLVIIPVKLKGANYDEWAKAMRHSIIANWKFGFVDGSIVEQGDSTKKKHWVAVNSMLISWITNTLDEGLRSQIEDFDIAQDLWDHLKAGFCVVSGTRVCHLKKSLGKCEQGPSEAVTDSFRRLSKVWKELVQFARVPKCSCGKYTCNIAKQVADIREEDYLHHFIIGLNDPFEAIRAQLLAHTPLPLVDEAYQTVINTKRLRVKGSKETEKVMAFKVESNPRARDTRGRCYTHCNREGNDEETCYQTIGFPDWWDDKRKGVVVALVHVEVVVGDGVTQLHPPRQCALMLFKEDRLPNSHARDCGCYFESGSTYHQLAQAHT